MASADVVVVGGGANGTSTAFHLTRLGVRNVLLLERRWLGAGATGKSGSLVRMHYTNEHESRLAFESLKVFRGFHAEVGGDCGFEPVGFVQLVGRGYADQLRRNVAMQQRLGIKTELVSPEDLPRLLPGVITDDVGGAAWEPESGYADPNATAFAFAAAAARAGARVETGREVTRVVGERGSAATLIGVELGVGHADPDHYSESVDPAYVARCRETLSARFPTFASATMRGGWAGMIMMSPDGRPVIDRIPSIDGLYVMLGDSGTSFKTSPAIGRCLAEWIVEGRPRTADLTPFRSTRFAEGKPWVDEDNYGRERLTISR